MLVGMQNPWSTDPRHALFPAPPGCTGERLWRALEDVGGHTRGDYLRAFERRNLVTGPWDAEAAQREGERLLGEIEMLQDGSSVDLPTVPAEQPLVVRTDRAAALTAANGSARTPGTNPPASVRTGGHNSLVTVVALGAQVQRALRLDKVPPLGLARRGGTTFRSVPHPSGRNPWFNCPHHRMAVGLLLEELVG